MSRIKRSWETLLWVVHYEGWLFAAFRMIVKASAALGTQGTHSPWFQRFAERQFDRRFRVATAGVVTPQQLHYTADQQQHAVEYCSTSNYRFGRLLSKLPIDHSMFTFVDLGSGKGRVLLMASEFPFQRVIGVELSEQLHSVAEQNIRTFCGQRRCPVVESICCDATQFQFPSDPLVLYLFNPFSQTILSRVVDNLTASLTEAPRRVIVIYYNPLHAGVFEESERFLECTSKFSLPKDWKVYMFKLEPDA